MNPTRDNVNLTLDDFMNINEVSLMCITCVMAGIWQAHVTLMSAPSDRVKPNISRRDDSTWQIN